MYRWYWIRDATRDRVLANAHFAMHETKRIDENADDIVAVPIKCVWSMEERYISLSEAKLIDFTKKK